MSPTVLKIIFLSLIVAAVIIETIGDIFLKRWALENKNIFFITGLAIYFVGSIFWIFSLRYEALSKAISIFTVLNLIIIVSVGVLYFKEDLSFVNKIGIAIGVLSIILMEI